MNSGRSEAEWVGQIGPEATSLLMASSYLAIQMGAATLLGAAAASIAFGAGSTNGTTIGVIVVVAVLITHVRWIRSRRQLARALSAHFGAHVGALEIPRIRHDDFDAWFQNRGFSSGPVDHT